MKEVERAWAAVIESLFEITDDVERDDAIIKIQEWAEGLKETIDEIIKEEEVDRWT